jgi:transcriptional regulator with XRE-family HTH domain
VRGAHRKENGESTTRGVLLRNLGQLRRAQAQTQRQLAKRAGVSSGTVWRLESLKRGAYSVTVRKLAAALEVPPAELTRGPRSDREDHASR